MSRMFKGASAFNQKLCADAWVNSKAKKRLMFEDSPGSILRTECTTTPTPETAETTGDYVSRRPMPERELIVRTPISTSVAKTVITSAITNTMTCRKCGTFQKSGRVSCCAPGGDWFKKCGGARNRNVDHKWFEGVEACKRKFRAKGMKTAAMIIFFFFVSLTNVHV